MSEFSCMEKIKKPKGKKEEKMRKERKRQKCARADTQLKERV